MAFLGITMDLAYRLIIYILIANVGYMMFSLARRGFRHYSGYIAEMSVLLSFMIMVVVKGYSSLWTVIWSLGGIFVVVGIPLLLQKQIEKLIAEQRFDEIEPLARWKANLAWSEMNIHFHEIAKAVSNFSQAPQEAINNLRSLMNKGDPYDGMTKLFLAMIHFQARKFDSLISDIYVPETDFSNYHFDELMYLVRGFLETGRYEEAISGQVALEKMVSLDLSEDQIGNLFISRMIFFAFLGWDDDFRNAVEAKAKILETIPKPLQKYWAGISAFNAGEFTRGEELMRESISSEHQEIPDHWLIWMRQRANGLIENKTFFYERILPELTKQKETHRPAFLELVKTNVDAGKMPELTNYWTNTLVYANIIAFLIFQFYGDFNDLGDLVRFGANSGFLVNRGEWYRLISYQFLHMGWLHLFMNVLALRYFGPPVETFAGRRIFLGIYFFSGICGGLATVWGKSAFSVGASGSVLGLLAAAIVMELGGGSDSKIFARSGNIATLVFILVINLLIGFVEKGIDNNAHLGGLIGGAVASLIFLLIRNIPLVLKFAKTLVVVALLAIMGYSVSEFAAKLGGDIYPINQKVEITISPNSWPFSIKIPHGWNPEIKKSSDKDISSTDIRNAPGWQDFSGTPRTYTLLGPLNERIDFSLVSNTDPPEEVIDEYVNERTRSMADASETGIKFHTRKGPISISLPPWKFQQIKWRLSFEERFMTEQDLYHFDQGWALLIQCYLPTGHDDLYDNLVYQIISSIRLKGDRPDESR